MHNLTDAEIAETRRLCEAAAPGPWLAIDNGFGYFEVKSARRKQPIVAWPGFDESAVPQRIHRANIEFIAAARTGWPRALAEVERLQAQLSECEQVGLERGFAVDTSQERIKALEEALRQLVAWSASSPVQAAFSLAYIHGQRVSVEFSENAGKIWHEADALLGVLDKGL